MYAAAAALRGPNATSASAKGTHYPPKPSRDAQVPSANRIVTVSVSGMAEPQSMHLPNRFRIRLTGKGAPSFNPIKLGGFLLSVGAIKSSRSWEEAQYYELGNPYERYVAFDPNDQDVNFNHGEEFSCAFDDNDQNNLGKLRIEDCRITETNVSLSFVAPSAEESYVEEALRMAGMFPIGLRRSRYRQDQWHFRTTKERDSIPHYIIIPMKTFCQEILVTIPGRWSECMHCGTTEHRTNQCPREKERKRQEYNDRQRKREEKAAETARKVEEARKAYDEMQKKQEEEDEKEVNLLKERENKRLEDHYTLVKKRHRKSSTPKGKGGKMRSPRPEAEEASSSPNVPNDSKRPALSLEDYPFLRHPDESQSASLHWDSKFLELQTPATRPKIPTVTPISLESESRADFHTPRTTNIAKSLFKLTPSPDNEVTETNRSPGLSTGSARGSPSRGVPKVKVETLDDPVVLNSLVEGEMEPKKLFAAVPLKENPSVERASPSSSVTGPNACTNSKLSTTEDSSDDGRALVIDEDGDTDTPQNETSVNDKQNNSVPLDSDPKQSTHCGVSSD